MLVSFQELKSLLFGVVLVCGVMLAGPLTSHASPADPFAVTPVKVADAVKAKSKPRASIGERFGAMLGSPKVSQTSFDLTLISATDFGDWDQDAPR
jgi:hypothetical protein